VLSILEDADPDCFGSVYPEEVGLVLLEHWDGWEQELLRDIQADGLAALIWSRYKADWLSSGHRSRPLDREIAGRVGLIAKESGWIGKHRKAIQAARKRLLAVKKVQES
jgi:hypothetical protein